jgi:hypothetical protein
MQQAKTLLALALLVIVLSPAWCVPGQRVDPSMLPPAPPSLNRIAARSACCSAANANKPTTLSRKLLVSDSELYGFHGAGPMQAIVGVASTQDGHQKRTVFQ